MNMFKGIKNRLNAMLQIGIESEIRDIHARMREALDDPLICYGYKVYSQCDEDGIIAEIFRRLGTKNRVCVEIGCGNGIENNTHYLLLQGWKGVWIDGSQKNIQFLRKGLDLPDRHPELALLQAYATPETVNDLLRRGLADIAADGLRNIDFLSLDIDGYDLAVLEAMEMVRPRVICAEYNAKFPPGLDLAVPYDPRHGWCGDDYMGASLSALARILGEKGYDLVCCNASAANAFFVHREANRGRIPIHPLDRLYQPARYHLCYRKSGHAPSLRFLRDHLHRFRS